ncbi:MAG: alpha/beta hydrolase [Chakrabartia sp.]
MSNLIERRTLIAATLTATLATRANAATSASSVHRMPDHSIALWPQGVPDSNQKPLVETIEYDAHGVDPLNRAIKGVVRPRIDVFQAKRPNGSAMLIMPGGGYGRVMVDHEGYDLARWLSARGVSAFVLFYRLPAEGWSSGPNAPVADAQRAMRIIRHRAREFHINAARIGAAGFSAGGHLCAMLATCFNQKLYSGKMIEDPVSARPDFTALLYPVISMIQPNVHSGSRSRLIGEDATPELERFYSPHLKVTQNTPRCFLLHAEDDTLVPPENSLLYRAALKAKGVDVETHLFAKGGHGFGLRGIGGRPLANWPELLLRFIEGL